MFAYVPDTRPTCPICLTYTVDSYNEHDQYLLHQHVGLVHPENGESPFLPHNNSNEACREGNEGAVDSSLSRSSRAQDHGNGGDVEIKRYHPAEANSDRSYQGSPSQDSLYNDYRACPVQCGESLLSYEIPYHMEMHDIEDTAFNELGWNVPNQRSHSDSRASHLSSFAPLDRDMTSRPDSSLSAPTKSGVAESMQMQSKSKPSRRNAQGSHIKSLFSNSRPPIARKSRMNLVSGPRRLGTSELGPYAYEEQMPVHLYKQLKWSSKRARNESSDIIPVLIRLSQRSRGISKVFFCHSGVKHIFKMPGEGGFCGYRNIQMAISFLQGTKSHGHNHFADSTPSIFWLQDKIEEAWDRGFNSSGRIETGGIRGTRKYIGTPEAQALFCSLDIGCEASGFNEAIITQKRYKHVHHAILQEVYEYFSSGINDSTKNIHQTGLPPLYFQHPGHSLTIVGIELRKSGQMNLLVFDPMFKTVPGVVKLKVSPQDAADPDHLLQAFRRGDAYLRNYKNFEILKFTNTSYGSTLSNDIGRDATATRCQDTETGSKFDINVSKSFG